MNYGTALKPPQSLDHMLNQFGLFNRAQGNVHPPLGALMLHISDGFIDHLTGRQSPYSEFDLRHAGATIPPLDFSLATTWPVSQRRRRRAI